MRIDQAIIKYHDSPVGYDWDKFWDYKCKIEAGGQDILDPQQQVTTSKHLLNYLLGFGMRRKSNLGNTTPSQFSKVLVAIHHEYKIVKNIKLETLAEQNRHQAISLFKTTGTALDSQGLPRTITLITKMFMALWGEIPGFDKRFCSAYRNLSLGIPPSQYSIEDPLFDSLLILNQHYNQTWSQQITGLPTRYRTTRTQGMYPIPTGRLIDMALWQIRKDTP